MIAMTFDMPALLYKVHPHGDACFCYNYMTPERDWTGTSA